MNRIILDVYFDFCPSETIREDSPYSESAFVCSCVLLPPLNEEKEKNIEELEKRSRNTTLKRLKCLLNLLKSKKIWVRTHCTKSTEEEFYALSKQIPPELPALEDIAKELNISPHKAASAFAVLRIVFLSVYSLIPGLKVNFSDYEKASFGFTILIDRPAGRMKKNLEIYRTIGRKYHKLLAGYKPKENLVFQYEFPTGKDDWPGHICADLLAGAIAGTVGLAERKMSCQLPKFSQEQKKEIRNILDEMESIGILGIYDNIRGLSAYVDKHT